MSALRTLWIVAALLVFPCRGVIAADDACPAARLEVQVETTHGELRELFDTTVADLTRIAKDRNAPLRHPILGVYISSIGISLHINDRIAGLGKGRRCSVPEAITVRLALTGRAVHLPRDFAENVCLLDLARGHQRKHAQADADLFDGIVSRFAEDLRARMATLVLEPAPSEAAARLGMTQAVRKIVEEQLQSYENAKVQLDKMVDTSQEVLRVSNACGGALNAQDPL